MTSDIPINESDFMCFLFTIVLPLIEVVGPSIYTLILRRNNPVLEAIINFRTNGRVLLPEEFKFVFVPSANNNNPVPIVKSNKYFVEQEDLNISLIMKSISYSDQGLYVLKIKTGAGTTQASVRVVINGKKMDTPVIMNSIKWILL